MNTKYGDIPSSAFSEYCKSLINRVWILIPLREEKCQTLKTKIERLNREMTGMMHTIPQHSTYIITVIHLLENVESEEDFAVYRSDILRCCDLLKKISGGEDNV